MNEINRAPSQGQIEKLKYLSPMLDSALHEMREFAKKKQDGIVSATKVRILNRLLTDLREVVSKEESVRYLDLLDEKEIPQNSDAVLVLGQYRAALDSFEEAHYHSGVGYSRKWHTKEFFEQFQADEDDDDEEEDYEE